MATKAKKVPTTRKASPPAPAIPAASVDSMNALLVKANAHRQAFGELIKVLLRERKIMIQSLHGALSQAGALGNHPANTTNLLGGLTPWKAPRLWATIQFLELDIVMLDNRFSAHLAAKSRQTAGTETVAVAAASSSGEASVAGSVSSPAESVPYA